MFVLSFISELEFTSPEKVTSPAEFNTILLVPKEFLAIKLSVYCKYRELSWYCIFDAFSPLQVPEVNDMSLFPGMPMPPVNVPAIIGEPVRLYEDPFPINKFPSAGRALNPVPPLVIGIFPVRLLASR